MNNFSILHISDLHFGRIKLDALTSLANFIQEKRDDIQIIIVTGDLTQRARSHQFLEAVRFLKKFQCPVFVVPGNHDVPLYNLFLRFLSPYKKFLRYASSYSQKTYEDDNLMIYGLWSLNRFSVMSGRISKNDLKEAEAFFKNKTKFKIIASHHPLERLAGFKELEALKPDLILSGHEHKSRVTSNGETLLISSGTSTSSRIREELNSFNLINILSQSIDISVYRFSLNGHYFEAAPEEKMKRRMTCPVFPPTEKLQHSSTPSPFQAQGNESSSSY